MNLNMVYTVKELDTLIIYKSKSDYLWELGCRNKKRLLKKKNPTTQITSTLGLPKAPGYYIFPIMLHSSLLVQYIYTHTHIFHIIGSKKFPFQWLSRKKEIQPGAAVGGGRGRGLWKVSNIQNGAGGWGGGGEGWLLNSNAEIFKVI